MKSPLVRSAARQRFVLWSSYRSFHRDVAIMDDLRPFRLIGFDKRREIFGRARHRLEHLRVEEAFAKFWIFEDVMHCAVQFRDKLMRHACGTEQAEPGDRLVTGQSALGDSRNVGGP